MPRDPTTGRLISSIVAAAVCEATRHADREPAGESRCAEVIVAELRGDASRWRCVSGPGGFAVISYIILVVADLAPKSVALSARIHAAIRRLIGASAS